MPGRFLFLVLLCAALPACRRPEAGAPSAHLRVDRTAPDARTLLDAPAAARFCNLDGTLTITGIGAPWSAALAIRTAWPPRGRYAVDSTLGGIGTAALAARAMGDSAAAPLVARTGSVDMDSGGALAGRFTAATGRDSSATQLAGSFSIARRDSTGCAGP
jgi:hypothetical protein